MSELTHTGCVSHGAAAGQRQRLQSSPGTQLQPFKADVGFH